MLHLFLQSAGRFLKLCWLSLWPPVPSAARRSLRRVLTMLLFLPFFGLVQLANWTGFLLDEIFFRGYRRVSVEKPCFITGVPRSGTTLVHRTIAKDPQFTTFSTWECFFAPSIVQRKLVFAIAALDRMLGGGGAALLRRVERRVFGAMDDVHGVALTDAEEDYFVFVPVLACFILVVPFPYAQWIWDMGEFDRRLDPVQRQRLMNYYRRCIQKHLYAHGNDRRFLSKNASFPPLLGSLLTEFPDARLACCLRDPVEVVPSQLSSLRDGMAFFDNDPYDSGFQDRLIDQLAYYYRNLAGAPAPGGQRVWVHMQDFKKDLAGSVRQIYRELGIELSGEYSGVLDETARSARAYRSGHRYRLEDFGLDEAGLRERFAESIRPLPWPRQAGQ